MTTVSLREPKELMSEHRGALVAYARRVMNGDALDATEEADRVRRVEEFFATGVSLGCTGNELARVLLKDALRAEKQCGCLNCRTRPPD